MKSVPHLAPAPYGAEDAKVDSDCDSCMCQGFRVTQALVAPLWHVPRYFATLLDASLSPGTYWEVRVGLRSNRGCDWSLVVPNRSTYHRPPCVWSPFMAHGPKNLVSHWLTQFGLSRGRHAPKGAVALVRCDIGILAQRQPLARATNPRHSPA